MGSFGSKVSAFPDEDDNGFGAESLSITDLHSWTSFECFLHVAFLMIFSRAGFKRCARRARSGQEEEEEEEEEEEAMAGSKEMQLRRSGCLQKMRRIRRRLHCRRRLREIVGILLLRSLHVSSKSVETRSVHIFILPSSFTVFLSL